MTSKSDNDTLRRVVQLVAILNLAYFGIEFTVARAIGSVSLFADSINFLEDASVNLLIVLAIGWTARNRARVGMTLAGVLLIPALAKLWTAWEKFKLPVAPNAALLSLTGAGALVINLSCALMLAKYRHHSGSLTKAAFLSHEMTRLQNVVIVAAGLVNCLRLGVCVAGFDCRAMYRRHDADAAREVWGAAEKNGGPTRS